ncbi:MAG: hypothetical protein ACP5PT_06105 [Brevinematia bacterium]
MEKVNLSNVVNTNLVSNVVREPNNQRDTSNREQNRASEFKDMVEIGNLNIRNTQEIKNMATTYERVGDSYERMSRPESALTAYQISNTLKPNSETVQKIDDVAARIASEGKIK